jgi:3,4-dihydroxy 2-butanone 4-phosphate synthase / GTP cyclohydrolase II
VSADAGFASVAHAIEELRQGRMVVVCGEEEGHLVMAAEHATAARINFMAATARGLIGLALAEERCRALGLTPMADGAAMVPIDVRAGGGISAHGRARTIRRAVHPGALPGDFARPGHVFPLRADPYGVLARAGSTEAAFDLARIAGAAPVAVVCVVLDANGGTARRASLLRYAAGHDLPLLRLSDLIGWRCRHEPLVERAAEALLPTPAGTFSAIGYGSHVDRRNHVALTRGGPQGTRGALVGVHTECLAGDALRALTCDCREHLEVALGRIAHEGGVLIYLGRSTRDLELLVRPPMDAPDYATVAQILADLGLRSVRLLADDPAKAEGLAAHGVAIEEQVRLSAARTFLVGHSTHSAGAMRRRDL